MLALVLFPAVIAQQNVEVITPIRTIVLTTSETVFANVVIKNNQPFSETFYISVFPSYASGVSATLEKSVLTVGPDSEENVKVYFSTPIDTEEAFFRFFITAKPQASDVDYTNSLIVQTVRKSPMYISKISVNKYVLEPENELKIEAYVTNIHPKNTYNYNLVTEIKKGEELIHTFIDSVIAQPKENVKIANSYVFGKYYSPGIYSVTIYLKDERGSVVSTKKFDVNLLGVYKLPEGYTEKHVDMGFLSLTTTIVIKNEGNVGTPPFFITEVMPIIAKGMFSSSIPPSNESIVGESVVYSWYVPYLAPGESIVIKYHVSFVGIWASLLIIGTITYFSYKYTFTASVIKRCRYTGHLKKDKEILVSISVKNKTTGELKDVMLSDKVPSFAHIIEKFDTIQPKVKKMKEGVILTWSLGNIKPKEEIILTYRIKPVLEIAGGVKLPSANITYTGKKGIQTVFSKSVILSSE